MKKLGLLVMGIACLGIACEFHASVGDQPKTPAAPKPAPKPAIPAPKPQGNAANKGVPPRLHGWNWGPNGAKQPLPGASASTTPAAPAAPPSASGTPASPASPSCPDPAVAPTVKGSFSLGSDQCSTTTWKGVVYFLPAAVTKLPDFTTMKPSAEFYTKDVNVPSQTFAGGFPGVDATRSDNFAIEYYNALNVTKEDDYWFRVVSDDGAKFYIDDTPIIDDDGQHTSTEKKGAAHLVTGAHTIRLDYFQSGGPMTVQLYVTPTGAPEKLLETTLP